MQSALIQGKNPISIMVQIPKWRLMKANSIAVRTGPVKNGKKSRNGPMASSPRVAKVRIRSKSGNWVIQVPKGVTS